MIKEVKNNWMKLFSLKIMFFLCNSSFAGDSFLLDCQGKRWLESERGLFNKEYFSKTYEIRDRKLIIRFRDDYFSYDPVFFNNNEIFYFIDQKPVSIIKNYYLKINRISGRIGERYDSFPKSNPIFYWKFEGFCKPASRKF
jgi:hypothetical protein